MPDWKQTLSEIEEELLAVEKRGVVLREAASSLRYLLQADELREAGTPINRPPGHRQGVATAAKLTQEERSEKARVAANKRWSGKPKKEKQGKVFNDKIAEDAAGRDETISIDHALAIADEKIDALRSKDVKIEAGRIITERLGDAEQENAKPRIEQIKAAVKQRHEQGRKAHDEIKAFKDRAREVARTGECPQCHGPIGRSPYKVCASCMGPSTAKAVHENSRPAAAHAHISIRTQELRELEERMG